MTSINSVTLEVSDLPAAEAFYDAAFGLGPRLGLRASDSSSSGFRGFTLSLVASQPGTVDALIGSGLDAGATEIKPAKKSFWGYGGVLRAPDGAIWKVATSSKKDSGPATREVDEFVLLLGAADVPASKGFYGDHGVTVAKSFARKYVQFDTGPKITLALYGRRALAKDAGVDADGSGSPRLVIGGDGGAFTDPDGFVWEGSMAAP
jgi:catechol 2,3-dioxygenase-like lactoylglutathione lyase family enzyme